MCLGFVGDMRGSQWYGFWHGDSHGIVPTIGGVHKIHILVRDLLKDFLRKSSAKISGGGQGALRPPYDLLGTCLGGLEVWEGSVGACLRSNGNNK